VHSRKAILAFCRLAHRTVWCATRHCPVRISFLIWRSRPLELWSRWRTRHSLVPHLTVGTCHASRADSVADYWLTGQSGAPPDSPVNFSRMPPTKSQEQLVDGCQPGAPDTVRCTQTEQTLGCFEPLFFNCIFSDSNT
jgi:hypothetical protein